MIIMIIIIIIIIVIVIVIVIVNSLDILIHEKWIPGVLLIVTANPWSLNPKFN